MEAYGVLLVLIPLAIGIPSLFIAFNKSFPKSIRIFLGLAGFVIVLIPCGILLLLASAVIMNLVR